MKNKRKTKTTKLTLSNAEIHLPGITKKDSAIIMEAVQVLVHYGVSVCHTIKEEEKKQTRQKKKPENKNGNTNSKPIRRSPSRKGTTTKRRKPAGSNAARSARASRQARDAKPTESIS
jgi:hypothetical protein